MDKFDANIVPATRAKLMPPQERELAVLRFFDRHEIPLPPKAVFRGLKVQDQITFSYSTVQNILSRLEEDGQVMRCDKDSLDAGRIEPIPDDVSGRRTYYFITDRGRERLAGDLDETAATE